MGEEYDVQLFGNPLVAMKPGNKIEWSSKEGEMPYLNVRSLITLRLRVG